MRPTRLLLIRHAATEGPQGRCLGRTDVSLSRAGHAQALALAGALAASRIDAVASSPARRAVQTAEPIAGRHGVVPRLVPALWEVDFGAFEGLTFDAARDADPRTYERWMRSPAEVRFPGGESYEDLRERVAPAVAAIVEGEAGRNVAIVAHGGVIRVLLADALSIPASSVFRFSLDHAAITVVDHVDGVPVVRGVNVPAGTMP
jgi:alpha-ribazole phosphatase